MDDTSTLTSNFTASGSGTFRTASSGARVQISSASSTPIIEFFDASGTVTGQSGYNSTADKIYMSGNATPLNFVTTSTETPAASNTVSRITLSANVIDFENAVGNSTPYIRIGDVTATNKYLTVDSSGKLAFSSQSVTGGVTSITAGGELSLTGAGTGDVTITHADSDHDNRYYTETEVNNLLNAKANSSHGTHVSYGGDGSNSTVSRSDHTHSSVGSHTHIANDVTGTISITSVSSGGFVNSLSYNNSSKTLTVGGSNTRLASITTRGYGVQSSGQSVGSGGIGVTLFYTSLNSVSDETLKTGITDLTYGLDWINDLRPISYRYDTRTVYVCETEDCEFNGTEYLLSTDECDGCDNAPVSTEVSWGNTKENWGFSAQEIEATLPTNPDLEIVEDTEFVDGSTKKVLDYNQVIAPLVKAVQELSQQNASLQARIEVLEGG